MGSRESLTQGPYCKINCYTEGVDVSWAQPCVLLARISARGGKLLYADGT